MQGNSKVVANCENTKCTACEFGKGHCRPNKVNKIKNNPMNEQELKNDHLLPGKLFLKIIIYRGPQVGSTTQKGSQINLICSQEDVSLLTMPVVM